MDETICRDVKKAEEETRKLRGAAITFFNI
jgi:hypothetical protein